MHKHSDRNIRLSEIAKAVARARRVLSEYGRESVSKTIWGSPAGKKRLSKRLAAMLPPHTTYVEPFAGSAAVLFAKERASVEVINDADPDIVQAYRIIQRLGKEGLARLGRMQWVGDETTFKRLIDAKPTGDVAKLHRFLYLAHFSYGKMRGKSFSPSTQGIEAKTVSRIETFGPRLKGVKIHGGDYERVVRQYDSANTAFFLDPPYPGYDVDVGESKFDEERFFEVLKSIKGKFLLTYGIRGKLPGLLKGSGFQVQRIRTPRTISAMRGVGGSSVLTQLVVTNYKPVAKSVENLDGETSTMKAEWSREYINDLPDEAFLYIEPGGEKDEDGKTVPRRLRHFPVLDADGKPDLPHVRNAIARIPQSKLPGLSAEELRALQDKARELLDGATRKAASILSVTQRPSPSVPLPAGEVGEGFVKTIPLIKAVDPNDERFVLGIVLEPDTVDAQGDIYSAEEVRQAAHRFMEDFGGLGLMHRFQVNDQVKVLESYLSPVDFKIAEEQVRRGTWLLAVRILSDELWEQVREGKLSGFSIGGSARRVPEEVSSPESRVSSSKQAVQKSEPPAQDSGLKAQDSVNRLLDIVVEEVSLVDRAANKRRFLVVKRSEEMSANTEPSDVSEQTEETEGQETPDGALEDSDAGDETTTLGAAVSALETLTEAVELLGSIENPDTHARVVDLASELLSVAERLAAPSVTTGAEDAARPDTSRVPELNAALETMIDYIKGAIERVSVLAGSVTPPSQPPAVESAPDKDKQIDTLIGELRSLTNMVKEQQQRLAKLEKRFGLPNSLPAGERRTKAGPKEDSWPLDLNNPMDRESVDKAVSFHEL